MLSLKVILLLVAVSLTHSEPLDDATQCIHKDGRISSASNCRVYYECSYSNGMTYKTCPEGHFFNGNDWGEACSWGDSETCHKSTTTEQPRFTPSPLPINLPPVTPSTETFASNSCSEQANGTTFKPTNSGCRSYGVCWSGRSHTGECPIGYSFNEQLDRCDTVNNHRCTSAEMCPTEGIFVFRQPGSCTEYNLCYDGAHMSKTCAPGLQFDAKQNRCAQQEVVRCYDCPIIDDPWNMVTIAAEQRDAFLVCKGGGVIQFQCALGLQWNQSEGRCEFPAETTTERLAISE